MAPDRRLGLYKDMSPIERNHELRTLFEALPVLRPIKLDTRMGRLPGQPEEIDDLTAIQMLNERLLTRASRESSESLALRVDALGETIHTSASGAKFVSLQYRHFQITGVDKPNPELRAQPQTTWEKYSEIMDWGNPIGAGPFGESTAQASEIGLYKYESSKALKSKMDMLPLEEKMPDLSSNKSETIVIDDMELTLTPVNIPLEGIFSLAKYQQERDQLLRVWRQDLLAHWGQEP